MARQCKINKQVLEPKLELHIIVIYIFGRCYENTLFKRDVVTRDYMYVL